jgi:hypothetical protein
MEDGTNVHVKSPLWVSLIASFLSFLRREVQLAGQRVPDEPGPLAPKFEGSLARLKGHPPLKRITETLKPQVAGGTKLSFLHPASPREAAFGTIGATDP